MTWIVKLYFSIGMHDDSIVLKADSLADMKILIDGELARRGATYTGSDTIQEGNE